LGLILDTSILIANERRGGSIDDIVVLADAIGETEVGISSVSVVELTHGIYRARTEAEKERRRTYTEKAFRDLGIHTVTLEIAQLAGRIEGEQAAKGIAIGFEDLVSAQPPSILATMSPRTTSST
jgi:tRNA(fMet)-specific endonuclease VapC